MKAFIRPDEKRHFKRFNMTTCDCRLTLLRKRGCLRERENCILVDLSYAGMRFHGLRPIGEGEVLDFLADIRAPWVRSGFLRACVRWVRALGSHECDCGVEFLESSKGFLVPNETEHLVIS
jgi:hypothetical protein